jgi:hypothetical protein
MRAVSSADQLERRTIYALRHDVYADELRQHPRNNGQALTDAPDEVNAYLVAKAGDDIVGFVAITPPNDRGYSIDKYLPRQQVKEVTNGTRPNNRRHARPRSH